MGEFSKPERREKIYAGKEEKGFGRTKMNVCVLQTLEGAQVITGNFLKRQLKPDALGMSPQDLANMFPLL